MTGNDSFGEPGTALLRGQTLSGSTEGSGIWIKLPGVTFAAKQHAVINQFDQSNIISWLILLMWYF